MYEMFSPMFSPRIAAELVAAATIVSVSSPIRRARESSDADLLRRALDDDRAPVTNNVVDFERLRRQRNENDDSVPPLIYTSDAAFPRDRRFIGRLVGALHHACVTDAVAAAGGVLWLHPAPPRSSLRHGDELAADRRGG